MPDARVKRSRWDGKITLTDSNCRKKSLPKLRADFGNRCAYCLRDLHPEREKDSAAEVDHFDPKPRGRKRHLYPNLMLACRACNLSKLGKPVRIKEAPEYRLLNCTKENEFQGHVKESEDGEWHAQTKAGDYHLISIDLNHQSHKKRRQKRRELVRRLIGFNEGPAIIPDGPFAEQLARLDGIREIAIANLMPEIPVIDDDGATEISAFLAKHGVAHSCGVEPNQSATV